MDDEPEEAIVEVDANLATSSEPIKDTSFADSINATRSNALSTDEVIAEQAERRKLRPLIIGVGLMAAVGAGVVAVHVLRATKTNHSD